MPTAGSVTSRTETALHLLLFGAVDYAGLFPPARLPLEEVVTRYAAYRGGTGRWLLGRLVVPSAQLEELARLRGALGMEDAGEARDAWPLTVVCTGDWREEQERLQRVASTPGLRIRSVEVRWQPEGNLAESIHHLKGFGEVFVEVPLARTDLLDEIRSATGFAKLRCGGVEVEHFPDAREVARFITECARRELPWKATAGLHHALLSKAPVTDEPGAARATMLGFLTLFLAATLAQHQACDAVELAELLAEQDPSAVRVEPDSIEWRARRVDCPAIRAARTNALRSFGSCSFEEPREELHPWMA